MHIYKEGDIIYSKEDSKYYLSKIVKIDNSEEGLEVWHRVLYKPLVSLPDETKMEKLEVVIWHVPQVAKPSEVTFLTNKPVRDKELEGYNEYLKHTG